MQGLVLWFNPVSQTGIVWCEDQGPLAFIGPDVALPEGRRALACGDVLLFSVDLRDDVRYVRDIFRVADGGPDRDPRKIIADYHQAQERAQRLSIVA